MSLDNLVTTGPPSGHGPATVRATSTTAAARQAVAGHAGSTPNALDRVIDALESNGSTIRNRGRDQVQAQCPAHEDRNPSLSIGSRRDGNGVVLTCHAGCETPDIVAALGLTLADLFDDDGLRAAWSPTRDYTYPGGRQVHRKPNKKFSQSGNKTDRSIFHGDRIKDAQVVYVVEGEKDVEVIEAIGGAAVCSAMGAGKADRSDWSALRGKEAIIVADRDKPGRKHAAQVAELLNGIAAHVHIVEPKKGKDVADHVAAGYTLDELIEPGRDGMPKLWRATELKPATQPRWLAHSRLPYAAVSLLVGEEGIGKSLLWAWLIAAITTGKALPGFGIPAREPATVVLVVTEDDWRDTVLPRCQVAEVDMSQVYVICTEDDGSGSPVFPRDMHLIVDAHPAPALVVVDAWLDTVPTNLRVRDAQQARQALHPWKEAATKTGAAILLLCHTNRAASPNPRDRYGATSELRKKARMTLYAQTDDDGHLIVGPEKANGARTVPASRFTAESVQHFEPTDDHDGTVPLLTYLGESEQTAREHLADNYAADHDSGVDDTVGWLAALLASGPQWSVDVHNARKSADVSEKKLRAAKLKLAVDTRRVEGDGSWFMALPQHAGQLPQSPTPVQMSHKIPGSDTWASGTPGGHLETPHAPTTSQDSLTTYGQTQEPMYNSETRSPRLGERCTVCQEQALWAPDSITRGVCERCWQTDSGAA